jgi:drug/metabolite transporter (DMT)-like permease
MCWRNFTNLIFICFFLKQRNPADVREIKGMHFWIAGRAFCGNLCFMLGFYSATLIPLFLMTTLLYTSPLWTSILAYFINREQIHKYDVLAIILCLTGVYYITQSSFSQSEDSLSSHQYEQHMIGIAAAFAMSWIYSMASICQRKMQDIYFAVITFWHFAGGSIAGILYYIVVERQWPQVHSIETYGMLLFISVLDFGTVNAQTISFQNDKSSFVACLGYMSVFYGFLIDQAIFDETIKPKELFGALLVFATTIALAVFKFKNDKS